MGRLEVTRTISILTRLTRFWAEIPEKIRQKSVKEVSGLKIEGYMDPVGHGTVKLDFETCCSTTRPRRLDMETYNDFSWG